MSKAYVRLEFGGDKEIVLVRGVRADGKTAYRLNGKRMTRQEVLEVLKAYNIHIDETSTIAQGEINRLINLNAKERRELLDLAAGIKEFEYKKKEAMSELEKVGIEDKHRAGYADRRMGFLKELEKEKEAAEKYIEMSKRMKELKYSILTKRRTSVQGTIEGFTAEIGKLEEKKKALEDKIARTAKRIIELGSERQKITTLLSESSDELSGTNKKLSDMGEEINALEVRIGTGNASIEEAGRLVESIQKEIEGNEQKIGANEAEISQFREKIQELEAKVEKSSKTSEQASEINSGARMKELSFALQGIEKNVAELQDMLSRMRESGAQLEAGRSNMQRELSEVKGRAEEESGAIAEAKDRARAASERKESLDKAERELQEQIDSLVKTQGSIDSEMIELRQQRAMARGRDSFAYDRLRNAFTKQDGFYGTAAELCNYESQYAEAIEAAAGSHFNYLVVDAIGTANDMIQYLKKNGLGQDDVHTA